MKDLKNDLTIIKENIQVGEQLEILPKFLSTLMEMSRQEIDNYNCMYQRRLKLSSTYELLISQLMDRNPKKQNWSLYKNLANENVVSILDEDNGEEYLFKLNADDNIDTVPNHVSLIYINNFKHTITCYNSNYSYQLKKISNNLKESNTKRQFIMDLQGDTYLVSTTQTYKKKKLFIAGTDINTISIIAENFKEDSTHRIDLNYTTGEVHVSYSKENFVVESNHNKENRKYDFSIYSGEAEYYLGGIEFKDNHATYTDGQNTTSLQSLIDKLDLFLLENDFSIDVKYISEQIRQISQVDQEIQKIRVSKKLCKETFCSYLNFKKNLSLFHDKLKV